MTTETYGTRLSTLDEETGERPSSRIGNAGNARTLINRLKYEDQTRMYRYTRIQGLLDGNPPWSQKALVDIGQGHRANFNLREGEGIVDSAKTPYYDLVFEVPYFAQITFRIPGADENVLSEWNDIISDEYYETLCAWSDFDRVVQLHQWQMIVNGVGPVFWPHSVSWYSEAAKARKILVPQETPASTNQLELCAVLHSWRADELESFIAKAGGKDEYNGWNVPLCKQAIIDCSKRDTQNTYGLENYDLYQRAIRTGDIFYGIHRSDRIYVASLFIKEFGGKVSQYIITDTNLGREESEALEKMEDEVGYLYKKKDKFDDFSQVICPAFFDTGPDGTWHTVKGLGPKIYDFCDVSNRTFCQMLDGAVIGSGVTLEAQDPNALEETQVSLIGGATVVAPGYKVVQTRIAESLNGAMTMRRELQNTLQSNTGSYRQRPAEESQEPTLGQAQMNYQQQALLSKGATNRYYVGFLDKFHHETLRRLMDTAQTSDIPGGREAKQFMQRCMERGIPEEILVFRNVWKVKAIRSVGYGSPQMRQMANDELMKMYPLANEVGKNRIVRMKAASLPGIGPSQVDAVFPKIENSGVPNAHAALAVLENNALRQPGGQALVEPQQNHSTHFDVHYQDAMKHLQDTKAQPLEKLFHVEQAGPHMHQHLNALKGDPTRKDEFKQKTKALNELSKTTDQLMQHVQEQQKAQQGKNGGQQQPDPEVQRETAKMHGELGLKSAKLQGEMALKQKSQAFKEHLEDQKTAANIRRENLKAGTESRRSNLETTADVRRKNMESVHAQRRSNVESRAGIARQRFEAMNKPKPQPPTQ